MIVRAASAADLPFLGQMLVAAACWRAEDTFSTSERTLADPAIARYLRGWGREGDVAVVADEGHRRLGAAWFRLFPADDAGYGFVAADVPELTIGVVADARGRGVGTSLLEALVDEARERSYRALSLSVEEDNPALRLYERTGFVSVGRAGNAWTMLLELRPS